MKSSLIALILVQMCLVVLYGNDKIGMKINDMKVTVEKSKNSSNDINISEEKYYYLVLDGMLPRKYKGFKVLGLVKRENGKYVYLVRLEDKSVKNVFSRENIKGFYGLAEVQYEGKISKNLIFTGESLSRYWDASERCFNATIKYYKDVEDEIKYEIATSNSKKVWANDGDIYYVCSELSSLHKLPRYNEVMYVSEHDMNPITLLNETRKRIHADSLQRHLELGLSQPTVLWLNSGSDSLTGRNIRILIYDTGVDSLNHIHPDFFELDSSSIPIDTVIRKCENNGIVSAWLNSNHSRVDSTHGTTVASVALGNGWYSGNLEFERPFEVKGIAMKAQLWSASNGPDRVEGDVANRSHTITGNAQYTSRSQTYDELTFTHNHPILVFAAGNWALSNLGTSVSQIGYYSVSAPSKNAICVGGSNKQNNYKWDKSSMGPTRDGRIKPDIVAPAGQSNYFPYRPFPLGPDDTIKVYIDTVAILDSNSNEKRGWGFSSSYENWGPNFNGRNLPRLATDNMLKFYGYDSSNADTLGGLAIQVVGQPIFPSLVMDYKDTLYLRYKVILPENSMYDNFQSMSVQMQSFRPGGTLFTRISFDVTFTDSAYYDLRVPIRWLTGDSTNLLVFQWLNNGGSEIRSANMKFPEPSDYIPTAGTSLAAPHVVGVIAIMLQKWLEKYVTNFPEITSLDEAIDSLRFGSRRYRLGNDLAKAILIHTATDLQKLDSIPGERVDPDTKAYLKYYRGPDFATGYGLINAVKAVSYIDTNLLRKDSISNGEQITYSIDVNEGVDTLKVTLAWDDNPGGISYQERKLIDDLDLVLYNPSTGKICLPWVVEPLPQDTTLFGSPGNGIDPISINDIKPAFKGRDSINNVEMVEIINPDIGEWKIIVSGRDVPIGTQGVVNGPVDFALVSDLILSNRDDTTKFQFDSLNFQINIGSLIRTTTATNEQNNTVYFGAGPDGDSLYAYSIDGDSIKWTIAPFSMAEISEPVLVPDSEFIYVTAAESLYCIRDDDTHATVLWSLGLANDLGTPALKTGTSGNQYIFVATKADGYPFWIYTIKTSTHSVSASYQITAPVKVAPVNASGSRGAFFDNSGTVHLLDTSLYCGMKPIFSNQSVKYQPIRTQNRYMIFQGGKNLISINDERIGFQLVRYMTFLGEDELLTNIVIDEQDYLYFIAYRSQYGKETRLYKMNIWDEEPQWTVKLADDSSTVSDISIGDEDIVYFMLDGKLQGYGFDGTLEVQSLGTAGQYSANIHNKTFIQPFGDGLYGYSVTSEGLYAAGWPREGKDNGNTSSGGLENVTVTVTKIGDEPQISSYGWDSTYSKYTICGKSSGIGGVIDNLILSFNYQAGDFDAIVKIDSITNTGSNAKAGIYATTDKSSAAAPNGFVWLMPNNTAGFSHRSIYDGNTTTTNAAGTYMPGSTWFLLEKRDSVITGFISTDGENFSAVSSAVVSGGHIYVGPAFTSGDSSTEGCAVYSDIEIRPVIGAYDSWDSSMQINFNTTQTGAGVAENVSSVPIAIRLSQSNFNFSTAQGLGQDIRFADDDGSPLPYEIELWDSIGQKAVIWVNVPMVNGNDSMDFIKLYWGNDTAMDNSNGSAVFDTGSSFMGVWHIGEDGNTMAGGYKDATINENHGTGVSMTASSDIDAIAGNGQYFDGSGDYIDFGNAPSLEIGATTDRLTMSAWVKFDGIDGTKFGEILNRGDHSFNLQFHPSPDKIQAVTYGSTWHIALADSAPQSGTWYHVAETYDGSKLTLWINGKKRATNSNTDGIASSTFPVNLGRNSEMTSRFFKGWVDEARIESAARDSDWIKLSYENQRPGSGFLRFEGAHGYQQGIGYGYYHGSWSVVPDFSSLTPVDTGNLDNFSLTPKQRNDDFGFEYQGLINIPTNGPYTFYTVSDDGSLLWIDGALVVNNDGRHAAQERSGSVSLTAGYHEIRVGFFECSGNEVLEVKWAGPGISKAAIPNSVLFRP